MFRSVITVSTSALLLVTATFYACQKDKIVPTEQSALQTSDDRTPPVNTDCPLIKSKVKNINGQLVFEDQMHFEKCIECLEQEVEAYNAAYESQYPFASAEQLDSLDDVNGFNEWQPLVDFAAEKGFNSLHSVVFNQSEQWLLAQNANTINFDNDPDETCPVMDEEERALFNASGFVRIGDNLVSIGQYAEPDAVPDCCAWLKKRKYTFDVNDDPYLVNRQLRAKIKIKSGLVVSKLKGKVKHYKKVNGTYKKRRAPMRVTIVGRGMMPSNCNPSLQGWSNFKGYKNRKTRKVTARIWSLWREAVVCTDDPAFPFSACTFGFFVDNDANAYALTLLK
jgi:hypothetical protein